MILEKKAVLWRWCLGLLVILPWQQRFSAFAKLEACSTSSLETHRSLDTSDINDTNETALNRTTRSFQLCPQVSTSAANIYTVTQYARLNFKNENNSESIVWNSYLEKRHKLQELCEKTVSTQVYLVPHSHTDIAWTETFEEYFHTKVKIIISNIVTKLKKNPNLTFVWNEISFLQKWWDRTNGTMRQDLLDLLESGRLEITTGGWVMVDEATTHVFAMLDQLIEGHQWLQANLNTRPTIGWSIDAFGYGPTMPYLLANANFKATVINRVHYAWKRWLAMAKVSDFYWSPGWSSSKYVQSESRYHAPKAPGSLLTHHLPFETYDISSCGPKSYICEQYDFRHGQSIYSFNIKRRANMLMQQVSRTASLTQHGVVMLLLGSDFSYVRGDDLDENYNNWTVIMEYINHNHNVFHTKIEFGTPRTYFEEVLRRSDDFPTLVGDFFVYSDKFHEYRRTPDYWSGFYTTRPFLKISSRNLEHNLRNTEILFTLVLNKARQQQQKQVVKFLERKYHLLVAARRNLGMFQHHDAITGTSKTFVMEDLSKYLLRGMLNTMLLQQYSVKMLLSSPGRNGSHLQQYVYGSEGDKQNEGKVISLTKDKPTMMILFNSLARTRSEVIKLRVNSPSVRIVDWDNKEVPNQAAPVWIYQAGSKDKLKMKKGEYEVSFIVTLPPLSLSPFYLSAVPEGHASPTNVWCRHCQGGDNIFKIKPIAPTRDQLLRLENGFQELVFNGTTGLLTSILKVSASKRINVNLTFASYNSSFSGAYVFKLRKKKETPWITANPAIVVTSGRISSDVTVYFSKFLKYTARIFHTIDNILSRVVYLESSLHLRENDNEFFMRFDTDIQNGDPPVFYTDSNGFLYQKRVKVPQIGLEGNCYPITTMTFLQDSTLRFTLLTAHSLGVSSWIPGRLEVMLDRRAMTHDNKGLSEGIVDNKPTTHKFWLVLESVDSAKKRSYKESSYKHDKDYHLPSDSVNQLSNSMNYPVSIFYANNYEAGDRNSTGIVELMTHQLPCDVHLVNLRTVTNPMSPDLPSGTALMVLHRQGQSCATGKEFGSSCLSNYPFEASPLFKDVEIEDLHLTSITGTYRKDTISNMSAVELKPMDLQTLEVLFK